MTQFDEITRFDKMTQFDEITGDEMTYLLSAIIINNLATWDPPSPQLDFLDVLA
jgi:hypothetical protein